MDRGCPEQFAVLDVTWRLKLHQYKLHVLTPQGLCIVQNVGIFKDRYEEFLKTPGSDQRLLTLHLSGSQNWEKAKQPHRRAQKQSGRHTRAASAKVISATRHPNESTPSRSTNLGSGLDDYHENIRSVQLLCTGCEGRGWSHPPICNATTGVENFA